MSSQIVLISGCSSGIGLATAVLLAKDTEKRFKIYATMRNLAKKGQLEEEGKDCLGDTLIIKRMDVCSDESVEKAVKEVLDTEGRIDVLCECKLLVFAILFSLKLERRTHRIHCHCHNMHIIMTLRLLIGTQATPGRKGCDS